MYVFRIAVGWSKRDIVNFSCSADCLDFTRAAWKDGIVTFYIEKLFDRDDITKLENYIQYNIGFTPAKIAALRKMMY